MQTHPEFSVGSFLCYAEVIIPQQVGNHPPPLSLKEISTLSLCCRWFEEHYSEWLALRKPGPKVASLSHYCFLFIIKGLNAKTNAALVSHQHGSGVCVTCQPLVSLGLTFSSYVPPVMSTRTVEGDCVSRRWNPSFTGSAVSSHLVSAWVAGAVTILPFLVLNKSWLPTPFLFDPPFLSPVQILWEGLLVCSSDLRKMRVKTSN